MKSSANSRRRATTPHLEPPGPATGVLKTLLPHPEEWGFAGYEPTGSSLLPAPSQPNPKALTAPGEKKGNDD